MSLNPISPDELNIRINHLWENQWFLLTSGDFAKSHYNAMTVSWGSLGYIWNRPFVQVFVRATRYTYRFMEIYPTFTLSALYDEHRPALNILGARSGREGDKIAASGLTPVASTVVAAPTFAEAELVIECRKMYWSELHPAQFLDPGIEKHYPLKDYHRIYFGEILAVLGDAKYSA